MDQKLREALDEFRTQLSPDQRAHLLNISTRPDTDAVLRFTAELDKENTRQRRRCVASRISTLLLSVQQFSNIVDTFVSSDQVIAPLIWGSIKFTFQAVINVASYFERLSEFVLELRNECPRFVEYQHLFLTSKRLQSALCDYYATVVRVCSKILQVTQRSGLLQITTAIWRPFDAEFATFRSNLSLCHSDVYKEIKLSSEHAHVAERQLQLLEREKMTKFRRQDRLSKQEEEKFRREMTESNARLHRQHLLEKLSDYNYISPLNRARKNRWVETCTSLVGSPGFQSWMAGKGPQVFWCSGHLGWGKTVLTASIYDYILTSPSTANVLSTVFFCEFTNTKSTTAQGILACITRQLLHYELVDERTLEQLSDLTSYGSPDVSYLIPFLQYLVNRRETILILDGVDECAQEERAILFESLKEIQAVSSTIKLFITTRPNLHSELFKFFPQHESFKIQLQEIRRDIDEYVTAVMRHRMDNGGLAFADPELFQEIRDALNKKANGMFLWVSLQINEICEQPSDDAKRQILKSLPKDLESTYQRLLERLSQNASASTIAKQLRWLVASQRALSLSELREAVAIEPYQAHRYTSSYVYNENQLVAWCAGLVIVDEEDHTVRLVHESFRKHLLEAAPHHKLKSFHFGYNEANDLAGEACVTYLHFNDFKRQLVKVPALTRLDASQILDVSVSAGLDPIISRYWLKLARKFRGRRHGTEFLVQQLRDRSGFYDTSSLQKFQNNYPFLVYANENWLAHTADISETSSVWHKWQGLLTDEENLIVQLPWDIADVQTLKRNEWRWILRNRHSALLHWIIKYRSRDGWTISESKNAKFFMIEYLESNVSNFSEPVIHFIDQFSHFESNSVVWDDCLYTSIKQKNFTVFNILLNVRAKHQWPYDDWLSMHEMILESNDPAALHLFWTCSAGVCSGLSSPDQTNFLYEAAKRNDAFVVAGLLRSGADVNAVSTKDGDLTALQAAAMDGYVVVVELLIAAGADIGLTGVENHTPTALHLAAERGHVPVVRKLLEMIASSRGVTGGARPLSLHIAAQEGLREIVDLLLKAGDSVDIEDNSGYTALHWAAAYGHSEVVKLLLKANAFVDTFNYYRQAVLHTAAEKGHSEVVKLLLKADASIDAVDEDGSTALHWAAANGHLEVVNLLLEADASVDVGNKNGLTALYWAARNGHLEIVKMLLEAGVSIDVVGHDRATVFNTAAKNGHLEVVKLLLKAGVSIDAVDKYGRTALHEAADEGQALVVTILIDSGANISLRDKDRHTALETAMRELAYLKGTGESSAEYARTVEILKAAGAKV